MDVSVGLQTREKGMPAEKHVPAASRLHQYQTEERTGVFLFGGLAFDHVGSGGLGGFGLFFSDLLGGFGGLCRGALSAFVHAFLKALDGAAQVLTHVLELAGTENEHNNRQNDEPVPDRNGTLFYSLALSR